MSWYIGYFIIYFIFMLGVAFWYSRRIHTYEDYLISGWNTGFWKITGTVISTFCGAAVFIGWMGLGFTVGLSGYWKFAFVAIVFSLILILGFARPLRRQRLITLADLFTVRFGGSAGLIPSVLSAFIYSVPTTALQLVGMSTVFNITLDISLPVGIFISFIVILIFAVIGGLPATILTDAIQSVIIIIGVVVLAIVTINHVGGLGTLFENSAPEYINFTGPDGLGEILLYALSVGPFYLVWQSTWQRIFAAKDEKTAVNANALGFIIAGVIAFLPFLIGLAARQFVPLDMHPDLVFSYVTDTLMASPIGGIVFLGLLAALMTGATSFILQGSSNLTVDIYKTFINRDASPKRMLASSRISVVIITALACLFAYTIEDIATTYQWALRLSATIMVFPFLAVMFWKRVTKTGLLTSMIGTAVLVLAYPFLPIGMDHALFGFTVSFVLLVGVSLMTQHAESETVQAAYFEKLENPNLKERS
ncbi:sodium:solute symporter family protein [Lacicoccus alkaliphilus]|uniref:Solute:Na+ symporter, SSS family n=1 Tax=Lacicoccus alkaliphilus DSM 16010 TaxID=1123231 RepID=A0A1M7G1F3_9BACL|nr:sodium:solute symporter family protein [Salinicoccus alkaliphilus]SHM09985.1 solute:Na+ symporter, SSS family [Salinicoccus alkaliphilus DSM 16010]